MHDFLFQSRNITLRDAERVGDLLLRHFRPAFQPVAHLDDDALPRVQIAYRGADDLSPLGGVELVRQKVKKLWYMAGDWRSDGAKENNFSRVPQIYAASETVLKLFPCEITFLGLEIGIPVISGACLAGKDSFTAHALADAHHADGRNSWDPMTALMALCGDEEKAGYSVTRGKARVDGATGQNYFSRSEDGKHAYVTALHEPSFYSSVIDFLLQ